MKSVTSAMLRTMGESGIVAGSMGWRAMLITSILVRWVFNSLTLKEVTKEKLSFHY